MSAEEEWPVLNARADHVMLEAAERTLLRLRRTITTPDEVTRWDALMVRLRSLQDALDAEEEEEEEGPVPGNPYKLTRRTAKNEACFRAAMALENALAGGWKVMDKYGEDGRDMVTAGVMEIVHELIRRSGRSREPAQPAEEA